ncbi:AAA family ATPase [Enterovibrio norvegicus]|uniref:AAA family ATPase n=1 Tax=Enterovibrio norvegicus TaxID=188144 RepID=UPI00389A23E6
MLPVESKLLQVFVNKLSEWEEIPLESLQLPRVIGYSSGLNENMQRSFLKNAIQVYEALNVRSRRNKQLMKLKAEYRNRHDEGSRERLPILIQEMNERFLTRYPHLFEKDKTQVDTGDEILDYINPFNLKEAYVNPSTHVYLDYDSAQLAIAALAILDDELLVRALAGTTFNRPVKLVLEYDLKNWTIEEELTKDIQKFIGDALPYSVTGFGKQTNNDEYELYELDFLRGTIALDFDDPDVKRNLRQSNIDSGLRMFERLYRIQQLGLKSLSAEMRRELNKDDYEGSVKKPLKAKFPLSVKELILADESGRTVCFDDLSDGEAQLLQILAMTTLYQDEQALFLYDEPETHLNPAWRTHFHSFLQQAMSTEPPKSQVFLATHSPFMISSLKRENVLMFSRCEDGTIDYRRPTKETYGASFDVLIKQHFGLHSLISQTVVEEIREQLKQGDSHAREWIEQNLGMSPEKAYLMKKLTQ